MSCQTVCKNLKKFRNISKVSKLDGHIVLCPVPFPEKNFFKIYAKVHIKVLRPCPILLDFFTLFY